MRKKLGSLASAVACVFAAGLISLGGVLVNRVGWPFVWLVYEWRDPSYVEQINYRGLWANYFFWLVIIIVLLGILERLKTINFSMKRVVFFVVVFVILLLLWAALHDIGQGEPDPYGEYLMLLITPVVFAFMGFIYKRKLLD